MKNKKEESLVEREKRKKAGAPTRKVVRDKIKDEVWKYPIFKGK
ncbi:MAG TPA: hypothetical protein VMV80_04245 [Anaerolineales bacterium]|nr:hypothetical protein [Anaerolineales bacterium]